MTDPNPPDEPESPIALKYDGPEHQGEMAALELAEVLRSMSDFVQALEAGDSLAGERGAKVKVKAFREGSFWIDMVVEVTKFASSIGGMAGGATAAVMVAFRFYWLHMRQRVKSFEIDHERGMVKVEFTDDTSGEWTLAEWELYNNHRAKKALKGLVKPLSRGATAMQIEAGAEVVVVPADRAGDFTEPDPEPMPSVRMDVWAQPDTVSFNPARRWHLVAAGVGTFAATIEDKGFIEGIAVGRIRIGKNDSFRLALRIDYEGEGENVRPRYFVERVIDHHAGAEQDALPFESEE